MMKEINKIYKEDCLVGMREIPDKSIDMILCDLPYGTTSCKWDEIIPLDKLWEQYERIIKDNGAIILTSKEPFTSVLRSSNLKIFKQPLVWVKDNFDNPMQAKRRHLNIFEDISIFYKKQCTYNPQGLIEVNTITKQGRSNTLVDKRGSRKTEYKQQYTNYPKNILTYKRDGNHVHPTQKPIALFEYLIRTYSNKDETILDNCIGSGTTAVAAINTDRNFIGFEIESEYVEIANKRIQEALEIKNVKETVI
ncbi:DNA-methyltransferase [Virgibacillus pantothenticus]|uniref:DNA-methyltransferase n=1 Tax=Virgibacillus pantothenticus TaxID=1473 RepID=UPI0009878B11|nr:site-specific DNA-methyltransferase [Virgibacillus pantothenticus]